MIPMGMDYRPTRAELEGRAAVPEPDAVQRTMTQAGEGVVAAWVDLEETLGDVLEGAPREVAVPAVCCVASGHALFVRLFEVGNDAAVPAERSPLRLAAYLTVQLLACCAAFHGLSVAEVLLRWRRGPNAAPRLTAALHSAAPLLWALSAYVSLAFYLLIYPDPVFQATVVAKEALGVPIRAWLHETHAGPLLVTVLDLAGGRSPMLLQRHLPSRGLLAAVSLCYALSYCLVLQYVAHSTGGWPYPVLARLSMQQRLLFCGASAAALALLALLARGAAAMRSALGEPRGKAASKRL